MTSQEILLNLLFVALEGGAIAGFLLAVDFACTWRRK